MTQKNAPWRAAIWRHHGRPDTVCVKDARGQEVISWMGFDGVPGTKAEIRERAKFVARACNSHASLLAAAERVLIGLNARIESAPSDAVPMFDGIADLHDAIAKAKGEQP